MGNAMSSSSRDRSGQSRRRRARSRPCRGAGRPGGVPRDPEPSLDGPGAVTGAERAARPGTGPEAAGWPAMGSAVPGAARPPGPGAGGRPVPGAAGLSVTWLP